MIKWSKNYLMGIDKLDEEHKELFRISDQIYNKVMERGDDAKYRLFLMNETLEYMLRYFKRHAKGEEIYMREIGYAGYEFHKMLHDEFYNMLLKKKADIATVYKGNIIKNLIMDCQSYTKYRPNETTGGIFVSWRRKEELPTGA